MNSPHRHLFGSADRRACMQIIEHHALMAKVSAQGLVQLGPVAVGLTHDQLGITWHRVARGNTNAGDRFYDVTNSTMWCAAQWEGEGNLVRCPSASYVVPTLAFRCSAWPQVSLQRRTESGAAGSSAGPDPI